MHHDGFMRTDDQTLANVIGLRLDRRQKVAERAAHAVQFVDQVEDDADAFIVDANVAFEVVDQVRPCHIDFRKILSCCAGAAREPAGSNPSFQSLDFKAGTNTKLVIIHAHTPVAC